MTPFAARHPEDVEFLSRMAWEFGPSYRDAIWHLREREQERRNDAKARDRERIAAVLGALALVTPEQKKEPQKPRKSRLRLVERVMAACL